MGAREARVIASTFIADEEAVATRARQAEQDEMERRTKLVAVEQQKRKAQQAEETRLKQLAVDAEDEAEAREMTSSEGAVERRVSPPPVAKTGTSSRPPRVDAERRSVVQSLLLREQQLQQLKS